MKKYHVLALVGTLALLVNLLVPGLAFGQQAQQGNITLGCSATAPSFSVTPAVSFSFTSDGVSGPLTASIATQNAFKNASGSDLNTASGHDYIEVTDVRDPSTSGCNNGLDLTVAPTGTFAGDVTGQLIPLKFSASHGVTPNGVYVVSSNDACTADTSASGIVCVGNTTLCGRGDGTPAAACTAGNLSQGGSQANYDGQSFADLATFTGVGKFLGSNYNTPATVTLMHFADGTELYGKAGLATSFGVSIPAGQPADTYHLPLQYTIAVNP